MRAVTMALAATFALAGCNSNVVNLFGNSVLGGAPSAVEVARARTDRPVAQQIVSVEAAETFGGAIVTAVALPPTQGHWDARLVRVPSDDPSVYLMEFRLLPPLTAASPGRAPSREVLAGTMLTADELGGVRTIAVAGATNTRSARR